MNGLLIYLLKASAVTALLYACYFLLMRKETCFGLNRAILLLIAVCAFVVPLLPSPVPVPTTAHSLVAVATSEVGREPDAERKPEVFVAGETNDSPHGISERPAPGLSWAGLLLLAYSVGVLFLLVKMFREAIVTIRLILGRKTLKHGKCRLIVVPDDTTACSLGRYVVISQRDFEYNSHEILTHEDAHRRFGHLFDSLFLNLCQVVLWFDPFIWLIRRDMREIHEFQADRYVLGQGIERRSYQMLVIRKCVGEKLFAQATGFHGDCSVKRRIRMMGRVRSRSGWKALAYVPLLFVTALAFGRPVGTDGLHSGTSPFVRGENRIPKDWFAAGTRVEAYRIGIDPDETKDGKPTVAIRRDTDVPGDGFGTLMQQCLPSEYAGKRVRMSGYMKSQDVAGWAGFWFRIDGQGARPLAFDNMHGRAVRGTTGWKKYEIVLDVPQQATNLAYGALLDGTGFRSLLRDGRSQRAGHRPMSGENGRSVGSS